ncbi:MAG: hypothetical protein ACOC5T_00880 [Elusimicrobiota bacterium]
MRYIRQTISISTVSDDEIEDKNIMEEVLYNLSKSSVNIQIEYEDPKAEIVRKYDIVRILKVHDKMIDIRAFQGAGSFIDRNISFNRIKEVKLVTSQHNIVVGETKISKFSFLDI